MAPALTANNQAKLFHLFVTYFLTYYRRMKNLINKNNDTTLLTKTHLLVQQ